MLVRYATVGLANTLVTLATFTILTRAGAPAAAASALGFAAGAVNGYLLNRAWTFRTSGPLTRYVAVQAVGAAASGAAIHFVTEIVVIPAVTLLTYTLVRRYVFSPDLDALPRRAHDRRVVRQPVGVAEGLEVRDGA